MASHLVGLRNLLALLGASESPKAIIEAHAEMPSYDSRQRRLSEVAVDELQSGRAVPALLLATHHALTAFDPSHCSLFHPDELAMWGRGELTLGAFLRGDVPEWLVLAGQEQWMNCGLGFFRQVLS